MRENDSFRGSGGARGVHDNGGVLRGGGNRNEIRVVQAELNHGSRKWHEVLKCFSMHEAILFRGS